MELEAAIQVSSKKTIKQRKLGVKNFNPSLPTCLARDWNKFGTAPALLLHCHHPVPTKSAVLRCYNTSWQPIFIDSKFYTQAEQSYTPIINPCNTNQNFKLLPFHSTPVQATGKTSATPECSAKKTDSPAPQPLPLAPPIKLGIAT